MDTLIYLFGWSFIVCLQALPLKFVAQLGRLAGRLAFQLDARHRRVALCNLTMCFGGEKSPGEIRAIAKENFRRLGENYLSAIKTAAMRFDELKPHLEFVGAEKLLPPRRIMFAGGHFGNFELQARYVNLLPQYPCAATYRALKQPGLNRLLEKLRGLSGAVFFERVTEGAALRAFMNQPAFILSLQIDQHGGAKGLRLPFLGHDCSTNPSPAIFALRYHCDLYTHICYRIGPAKWRIEIGEKIPTRDMNGRPRDVADLIRDVLRAQETAVRRDPANWFWVHRRWKSLEKKPEAKMEDGG